jgi:hypothetical protein
LSAAILKSSRDEPRRPRGVPVGVRGGERVGDAELPNDAGRRASDT